jgi:hypothetical protein
MRARKGVFTRVQRDTPFEERPQTVTVYEKINLQSIWIYRKEVGN